MAKVTEITVWTRGVVMDKEARDVANAFAQAAKMEGKFVQAFDNYEDLPDRVLVTTRKYARISDEEIEMKYVYTNASSGCGGDRRAHHRQRDQCPERDARGRAPDHQYEPADRLHAEIHPQCRSAGRHRHGGCRRDLRDQDRRLFRFRRRRGHSPVSAQALPPPSSEPWPR